MKKEIKELRVNIDGLAQLTKDLTPVKVAFISGYKNSQQIEKAVDSLYLAKAWLGIVLGELGEDTPYANDGNRKTVEDIEPTADTHKGVQHLQEKGNWNTSFNHIEKVDWLREEIKRLISAIYKIMERNHKTRFSGKKAWEHLHEAKFWLGFELQRIKENE